MWLLATLLPTGLTAGEIRNWCGSRPNSTLVFGMVTKGNAELTLKLWRPTFDTYLTKSTSAYGCQTRLLPLEFDSYDAKTANQEIDFIFPNPTAFTEMKDRYGVQEFLSVKRNFGADQVRVTTSLPAAHPSASVGAREGQEQGTNQSHSQPQPGTRSVRWRRRPRVGRAHRHSDAGRHGAWCLVYRLWLGCHRLCTRRRSVGVAGAMAGRVRRGWGSRWRGHAVGHRLCH